jgi:hypothetical protein
MTSRIPSVDDDACLGPKRRPMCPSCWPFQDFGANLPCPVRFSDLRGETPPKTATFDTREGVYVVPVIEYTVQKAQCQQQPTRMTRGWIYSAKDSLFYATIRSHWEPSNSRAEYPEASSRDMYVSICMKSSLIFCFAILYFSFRLVIAGTFSCFGHRPMVADIILRRVRVCRSDGA